MRNDQTFSQHLVSEDWASLSVLLAKINLSNIKNKILRKKLQFIKNTLYLQMNNFNGSNRIEASFLIGALKTLLSIEKEFNGTSHDFLIFYKMVVNKLECQKLVVNKTMEKRLEFKKMKSIMEA